MKKIILSLLFILLFSTSVLCQTQIINMTEDTTPTTDDLLYVINDPLGVPGERKVQIGNLPKAWGTTLTELGYTSGVTSPIQTQLDGKASGMAADPIWAAIGDLAVGTGADTATILPAGTAGYLLKMGAATPEWSNTFGIATLNIPTSDADPGTTAGQMKHDTVVTGSSNGAVKFYDGTAVRQFHDNQVSAIPLLTTGIVDGKAPIVITTTTSNYQLGATYQSGYTFLNPTSSSGANSAILPAVAAGYQYCVGNYAAKTGTLTVSTKTGSGVQYIDLDGVLTANTGHVQATAVAGNFACFVGLSDSVWKAIPTKGVWTKD